MSTCGVGAHRGVQGSSAGSDALSAELSAGHEAVTCAAVAVAGGSQPLRSLDANRVTARGGAGKLPLARASMGCIAALLARADGTMEYEQFLRRPGRHLYVPLADCPCHDPLHGRDNVEALLRALPPRVRRELRRVVARLDEEFEQRTLPDPMAPVRLGEGWWHRRLMER